MGKSLHFRLLLTYAATVLFALGVLSVLFLGLLRASALRFAQDEMVRQGRELVRVLSVLEERPRLGQHAPGSVGRLFGGRDVLQRFARLVDGDLYLVDDDGRIQASSTPRQASNELLPGLPRGWSGNLAKGTVLRGHVAGAQGDPAVLVAVPWPNQEQPKGSVLLVKRVAGAEQAAQRVFGLLAWTAAGVGAVTLALIFFLSRYMMSPLRQLAEAVQRVAAGDYTQRIPVQGEDEIAQVVRHFNNMAQRIQETVGELRRVEATRRELVAGVSHELRTPLTSLQGFAEALRDGVITEPAERQRYLQVICDESARMARLVNDLFELTKIDSGQISYQFHEVDLADVARRAVAAMEAPFQREGVTLELRLPPQPVRVIADAVRIAQVLHNLLANALRFTPRGGLVSVELSAGGKVSVSDTGPGIAPEDLPHLFERYYQGRQEGGKRLGGSGLGLAIAHHIVAAHGGRMTAANRPEGGARFTFELKAEEPA